MSHLKLRILFPIAPEKSTSAFRKSVSRAALPAVCSLLCIIPAALQTPPAAASPQIPKTGAVGGQESPGVQAAAEPLKSYTLTMPGSVVKVEMIAIPPGSLTTGGKKVPVKPFWIANTETTWEAFDLFLASGPPSVAYDQTEFPPDAIARPSKSYILPDLNWGHHGYPVINISFLSVTMFCRWLSAQTGKHYRLPTETEWEYACRAGATSTKPMLPAQLNKTAWYAANSEHKTHPVAKKLPNAWKLYDMQGNVGEWATDAEGKQILCGGVFKDNPDRLLPTMRRHFTPAWQATDPQLPKSRWWLADGSFIGFRIVCEP